MRIPNAQSCVDSLTNFTDPAQPATTTTTRSSTSPSSRSVLPRDASTQATNSSKATADEIFDTALLPGTNWKLAKWQAADGKPVDISGDPLTLKISNPDKDKRLRVSGTFDGTNSFNGNYSIHEGKLNMHLSGFTRMAPSGQGAKNGDAYVNALEHIGKTRLLSDTGQLRLRLTTQDGQILTFDRAA